MKYRIPIYQSSKTLDSSVRKASIASEPSPTHTHSSKVTFFSNYSQMLNVNTMDLDTIEIFPISYYHIILLLTSFLSAFCEKNKG